MNTIREDFKEPKLEDVQRAWIRWPATVIIFALVVIVIFAASVADWVRELWGDVLSQWPYAKQCWKGSRD